MANDDSNSTASTAVAAAAATGDATAPAHTPYRLHAFICTNERSEGHRRGCCARKGSAEIRGYLKRRAKELGLADVRINVAGCLDHCEQGPACVVYPDGAWYRLATVEDAEAVLQSHLKDGIPVERLLLGTLADKQ